MTEPLPVIGPEYWDKKVAEMPRHILEEAVEWAKQFLSEATKRKIRKAYEVDPDHWISGYHFGWGMGFRNALRDAGFDDADLPDKNWDDYYHQVVEIAVGVREMPKPKIPKGVRVRRVEIASDYKSATKALEEF